MQNSDLHSCCFLGCLALLFELKLVLQTSVVDDTDISTVHIKLLKHCV